MKERELERALKALANKRRLAIVALLKKSNTNDVGGIADHLKISFKATSKHLGILTSADILEREQRSLQAFYSINKDAPEVAKKIISIL
ncbi:hypothetical protein A2115_02645 [Candidatus Woesebacteria bacterium GWA1_41_8]|uniref:HTH arsR-type domain-containing protein n=1 Tax=Candidatus Woesebacteria bacterium GWA1_41_8 TaxID=1802471 RepID=A0A1F7WK68_9BACT|nr:MAG: hypothetical protein A2115_02645 [Candidatus Woesebacteria bacterium GWA1_41_8]